MLRSIPFHPNMTLAFSHIAMHASSTQSVNIPEIFNAYQYIIFKLDFCPNNFHIFQFSRSGKGEVDVYRFLSKKSSDHHVLFFSRLLLQLTINASSCMKLMHAGTDFKLHTTIWHYFKNWCIQGQILSYTPRFDTTLRIDAFKDRF